MHEKPKLVKRHGFCELEGIDPIFAYATPKNMRGETMMLSTDTVYALIESAYRAGWNDMFNESVKSIGEENVEFGAGGGGTGFASPIRMKLKAR